MRRTTALFGLALASLLSFALAQATTPKPASGVPAKTIAALGGLQGQAFEIAYLSALLEFHEAGYELVQEEYVAGRRAEVKAASDAMFDALKLEERQLEGWLKTWYDKPADTAQRALVRREVQPLVDWGRGRVTPGHDMNMAADPDRAFVEAMALHHEGELELWRLAALEPGRASRGGPARFERTRSRTRAPQGLARRLALTARSVGRGPEPR